MQKKRKKICVYAKKVVLLQAELRTQVRNACGMRAK